MAWLDDRVWCHPKIVGLSANAFRAHINAIAYSSGFGTAGVLSAGQQKIIGASGRDRRELVAAELWDQVDAGGIQIHDWDEHNGKRDARRAADRERKRQERDNDPDSWVIRTGRWKTTRALVFKRDEGKCVDCGTVSEGWHADHVPDRKTLREQGLDPFDLQFIQTRCQTCHGRRHILERTGKGLSKGQNKDISADGSALTGDGGEGSATTKAFDGDVLQEHILRAVP